MTADLSSVTAAVLAGGLGTRLRSALADRPKVLAPVAGRPFLTYLLDHLAAAGIRRVVLCTGYRADLVRKALGDRYQEIAMQYSVEPSPLGTGGALRGAMSALGSPHILVANGDSLCLADMKLFWRRHQQAAAKASLLLTHVPDTSRFGVVNTDATGRVTQFAEKAPLAAAGWINAGVYAIDREVIASLPPNEAISLERQVFPTLAGRGLCAFGGEGPFLDIGTPESLAQADSFVRLYRCPA